jgi:hypothetical protein
VGGTVKRRRVIGRVDLVLSDQSEGISHGNGL